MKKLLSVILTLLLVSLFTVYASAETENVAIGASYEVLGILTDGEGKVHYPDENGDSLTNNVFAQSASYSELEFVGLNITSQETSANNGISEIRLDLGKVYTIVNAAVSCSNLNSAGISLPGVVNVIYSVDGESWSEPVLAEYEVEQPADGEVVRAVADLYAEARYITFQLAHNTNWIFVDEVQAFAGDISNPEKPEESNDANTENGEQSTQIPEASQPLSNAPDNAQISTDWIYIVGVAVSIAALIAAIIYRTKKK